MKNSEIIEDFTTLKQKGNIYMQDHQYLKAVNEYSKALLKLSSENNNEKENINNKNIILSNRAEAFIKLGYFHSGLNDCNEILNSIEIEPKIKEKSLFRKGRCLEQISNSLDEILIVKKIYDSIGIKKDLNEKENNLKGIFNKEKLLENEKKNENIINNSKKYYLDSLNKENSFINYYLNENIFLDFDEKKGYFYKAKNNIEIGKIIVCEMPIVSVYQNEIKRFSKTFENFKKFGFNENEIAIEILYTFLKDRMCFVEEEKYLCEILCKLSTEKVGNKNFEERKKIFYEFYKNNKNEKLNENNENNNNNIYDNNDYLKEIISNNSILTTRNIKNSLSPKEICFGLFYHTSFFNHNCIPNCFYFGISNYIIIKSIKNINKNEELTLNYIEPKFLFLRQNEFEKWNFNCECELCKNEKEISENKIYLNLYSIYCNIHNIINLNNIKNYDDIINENKLNVLNQDNIYIYIENLIKQNENVFDYNNDVNNKLKFNFFILFKSVGMIMGCIKKFKSFANFCFEKAYEAIRFISMRERFELVRCWFFLCDDVIYKLRKIELEIEHKNDEKILYDI